MKKCMAVSGASLHSLENDFEIILLPKDYLLAEPVQAHADMILTVFDGKLFCHSSYYKKNSTVIDSIAGLGGLKTILSSCPRNSKYPLDIAFNALCLEDKLICKKSSICPELRAYPIINTNQGYAGCTSLYAAGAVITADEATAHACIDANIPYYRISGKDILLPGYDTGFIGGACGVYKNTVYIYGDPDSSQSGWELARFCEQNGLTLISVFNGPVTDIGGIKFIEKYAN